MNTITTTYMRKSFVHYVSNATFRNILLGAGLAYCIEKKAYWHIPIVIAVPSIYAGYNVFKSMSNSIVIEKEE